MKSILFVSLFIVSCLCSYGQAIPEPEFVGEIAVVKDSLKTGMLGKQQASIKTSAFASAVSFGFAPAQYNITLAGCCAETIFKESDRFQFIVRVENNDLNPLELIQIFKFEQRKKDRRASIMSVSVVNTSTNELKFVGFTAKKYGENSYIVTLNEQIEGQYGMRFGDSMSIASFAIEK